MHGHPLPNPFLALRPFAREDAARFYGRDSDLILVQSRLYSSRTTLLFAGSGVGKTSFLNARLTPTLEGQWFIAIHRKWATTPPLEALQNTIAAAAPSPDIAGLRPLEQLGGIVEARPTRECLLILDQFEEVFQHWRDSRALDEFAAEIARVVHTTTLDARVLFSMREEFLGELSLFDNLIPDLFNNCYRLKNPTRTEAEEIIEKTAFSEQATECGAGLEPLIGDLLSAPRIASMLPQPEPSGRSRVPMPFLQIVCHRLWEQQLGRGARDPFPARFLETYSPGRAASELEAYCREKLEDLTVAEQDLAAAAFGFLMTPGGAKMAYPVDVLAIQAKVPEAELSEVLLKLTAPEVRILREIPAGRGSHPWFELYHDLYARFLSDWKRNHDAASQARELEAHQARLQEQVKEAIAGNEKRVRFYRRLAGLTPFLLVALWFLASTANDYFSHYRRLRNFAAAPTLTPNPDEYMAARTALGALDNSVLSKRAHSLWAVYWQQRAQLEMLAGVTDDALLSQIRSVVEDSSNETVRRQLANWLTFGEVVRTFGTADQVASWGYLTGGKQVYAISLDCSLIVWDRSTGAVARTWANPKEEYLYCGAGRATLSPDGNHMFIRSPGKVSLVHLESGREVWSKNANALEIANVSFSPDGAYLVLNDEKSARLISTAEGNERLLPDGSSNQYYYSKATGNLIGVARDGKKIVILGADTTGPAQPIDLLGTSLVLPDGTMPAFDLAPLVNDRVAVISRFPTPKVVLLSATGPAKEVFSGPTYGFATTPDGSFLFIATYRGICRMSIDSGACEWFTLTAAPGISGFDALSDTHLLTFTDQRLQEIDLTGAVHTPPATWPPGEGQLVEASWDGRWVVIRDRDGCHLEDARGEVGRRDIASLCPERSPDAPPIFIFNPSGTRLLTRGEKGEPASVIEIASFQRSNPNDPAKSAYWVSDDYLAVSQPDQSVRLFNAATGVTDPVDDHLGSGFRPATLSFRDSCDFASNLAPVSVSADGQHALSIEHDGLILYEKTSGRWSKRTPIPMTSGTTLAMFSHDSSRFLGLLPNSVIGVWTTGDANRVKTVSDNAKPLCAVAFGPNDTSILGIEAGLKSQPGLALWTLDRLQAQPWRTTTSTTPELVAPARSRSVTAAVGQLVVWISLPDDAKRVTLQVRPTMFAVLRAMGIPEVAVISKDDDTMRLARRDRTGTWQVDAFDAGFADARPLAAPTGKTWKNVYDEWSKRVDRRLNEESGLYEPLAPPASLPAPSAQPSTR